MVAKDQRAARTDLQARTHFNAAGFQFLDFGNQVMDIKYYPVTDVTAYSSMHNAGGNQIELVHLLANDQRMAGIVPPLKTHDATCVIG